MKALAQETGARAFFPTELGELAGVYASIAEELATQYAIGYASKNPRARWRLSSGHRAHRRQAGHSDSHARGLHRSAGAARRQPATH